MQTIEIQRSFHIKEQDIYLPDPDKDITVQEVMEFYSAQYAELTTASWTGPEIVNDQAVYTFSTVIGNKG